MNNTRLLIRFPATWISPKFNTYLFNILHSLYSLRYVIDIVWITFLNTQYIGHLDQRRCSRNQQRIKGVIILEVSGDFSVATYHKSLKALESIIDLFDFVTAYQRFVCNIKMKHISEFKYNYFLPLRVNIALLFN